MGALRSRQLLLFESRRDIAPGDEGDRVVSYQSDLPDIKPRTPVASLKRSKYEGLTNRYSANLVLPVVGTSAAFAERVTGRRDGYSADDVLDLIDQHSYRETFVPRSRVIDYLFVDARAASRGVTRRLEVPREPLVAFPRYCPGERFPSDHLSLLVELRLDALRRA